jgi:hypothetical protein
LNSKDESDDIQEKSSTRLMVNGSGVTTSRQGTRSCEALDLKFTQFVASANESRAFSSNRISYRITFAAYNETDCKSCQGKWTIVHVHETENLDQGTSTGKCRIFPSGPYF